MDAAPSLARAAVVGGYLAKQGLLLASSLAVHARWPVLQLPPSVPVAATAIPAVQRRFGRLLRDDLALVADGVLSADALLTFPVARMALHLPRLVAERRGMDARRSANRWRELPPDVDVTRYPPYFRRTYHWQRDGYLSDHSATLYDSGVELLFLGAADVMRRRVLPPVVAEARARPDLRVLDVACGTGRTLGWLARAVPRAELTGVDLSAWYLKVARRHLRDVTHLSLLVAPAEDVPLPEGHFDVVTSTWLLHELPRAARAAALAEMVRLLRPGGLLVVMDAAQPADDPELEPVLRAFPRDFHEPFFDDYLDDPLEVAVAEAGAVDVEVAPAWLSKRVVGRRPA